MNRIIQANLRGVSATMQAMPKINSNLIVVNQRFIGKTESPHKFKTPKLRMKNVRPIYPPPGMNLEIPEDLDVQTFFRQIGGDCEEYADAFENMHQVMTFKQYQFEELEVPCR